MEITPLIFWTSFGGIITTIIWGLIKSHFGLIATKKELVYLKNEIKENEIILQITEKKIREELVRYRTEQSKEVDRLNLKLGVMNEKLVELITLVSLLVQNKIKE